MRPGIAGLLLHGAAGIGKSVLAAQMAERISAQHPGTQVATVTGAVTVEQLAAALVADGPSLIVLDQFEANFTDETIADRGLAAVLVCLAEEITGRDDQRRRARIIATAREPLALSPRILAQYVGPLNRWSANEFARSLPRLGKLTSEEREYAWRLTAGNPRTLLALDAQLADAKFAQFADSLTAEITARTGLPVDHIFPTGLEPAAVAAMVSAAESVLSRPAALSRPPALRRPSLRSRLAALNRPRAAPRVADSPDQQDRQDQPTDAEDDTRRRRTRLRILIAALIAAVIAWAPFAVRPLVAHSAPATVAVPAAGPASQGQRAVSVTSTAENTTVESAAAAWLAANVTSGALIGCDPVMCTSLSHQGLARSDLTPLRAGGDLAADSLIVSTPQARQQLGSAITAVAPELTASFGTGSDQVEVREVTSGGAADYPSRVAADLASRREAGNLIMGNASIKASGNEWIALCSGRVDSRILLALAEIAHSAPLTVVSFGTASPGSAPEVPLRSILINLADPSAAAADLKVQNPVMQPLAVRIGRASLWVEFGAPVPLGLFQAES